MHFRSCAVSGVLQRRFVIRQLNLDRSADAARVHPLLRIMPVRFNQQLHRFAQFAPAFLNRSTRTQRTRQFFHPADEQALSARSDDGVISLFHTIEWCMPSTGHVNENLTNLSQDLTHCRAQPYSHALVTRSGVSRDERPAYHQAERYIILEHHAYRSSRVTATR